MGKQELFDLIDKAGKGSIEAAEEIAVGYFNGSFDGKPNLVKAKSGLLTLQNMAAKKHLKYCHGYKIHYC